MPHGAAGGRITDLDGGPLTLASTSVLATNGRLHDAVLEAIRSGESGKMVDVEDAESGEHVEIYVD